MFAVKQSNKAKRARNKRQAISEFNAIENPTPSDIRRVRAALTTDFSDML